MNARQAFADALTARRVLARFVSARDYKEYVEEKKQKGEKPLDKKDWEARQHGGEKDEPKEKSEGKKDEGKKDAPKVKPLASGRDLARAGGKAGENIRLRMKDDIDQSTTKFQEWEWEMRDTSSDYERSAKEFADKQRKAIKKRLDDADESIQDAQVSIEKLFQSRDGRQLPKEIHDAATKATEAMEAFDEAHKRFCDQVEVAFKPSDTTDEYDKLDKIRREMWDKYLDFSKSLRLMDEAVMKYRDN